MDKRRDLSRLFSLENPWQALSCLIHSSILISFAL